MAPAIHEARHTSNAATPVVKDTEHIALQSVRSLFPVASKVTYLNASYQMPLNVLSKAKADALLSDYVFSPNPKDAWMSTVADAYKKVAHLIKAKPEELAFTKNTSEGINIFVNACDLKKGDNVIIFDTEHLNQAYAWIVASQTTGFELRQPRENREKRCIHADDLMPYVDAKTKAIGISLVMFHSGQLNDIRSLADRFRPMGIKVVVDCTQAVGFMDVDVQALDVDAISFAVHKGLGTPAGLGVFWATPAFTKSAKPLCPAFQSISNIRPDLLALIEPKAELWQDARRFQGGNTNYISLACLNAYLDLIEDLGGIKRVEQHLRDLGNCLKRQLKQRGLQVATVAPLDESKCSSHSVVLQLDTAFSWQAYFASHDIYVSQYRDGVRISFGIYNTNEDVVRLVDVLSQAPNM